MSADQGEQGRIDAVDPFVRSKVLQARDDTIYQPSQPQVVGAQTGVEPRDPLDGTHNGEPNPDGSQLDDVYRSCLTRAISAFRADPSACANIVVSREHYEMLSDAASRVPLKWCPMISDACDKFLDDVSSEPPRERVKRLGQLGGICAECKVSVETADINEVLGVLLDEHADVLLQQDLKHIGLGVKDDGEGGVDCILVAAECWQPKALMMASQRLQYIESRLPQGPDVPPPVSWSGLQDRWVALCNSVRPKHLRPSKKQSDASDRLSKTEAPDPQERVKERDPRRSKAACLRHHAEVDPSIVRAFIHRVDSNFDEKISAEDLGAVSTERHLHIPMGLIHPLILEIVSRRPMQLQSQRSVDWNEIYRAIKHRVRWDDAVEIKFEIENDGQWTIEDIEDEVRRFLNHTINVYFPEGAEIMPGTHLTADTRAERYNALLEAIVDGMASGAIDPPREDLDFYSFFPPQIYGDKKDASKPRPKTLRISVTEPSHVWSNQVRPHRSRWLKFFNAIGLNPFLGYDEGPEPQFVNPDIPKVYHDNQRTVSCGQSDGMTVAPKPAAVEIHSLRPTEQYPVNHQKCTPVDNQIKFPDQLWEKHRKDREDDVQKSFTTVNADASGKETPFISFAAQEKFRKNNRAMERKSELAGHLSRNNTRKEATFCQSRHNSDVQRDWPCEPAAIWNGSHIDHTLNPQVMESFKWNGLTKEERDKQWYVGPHAGKTSQELRHEAVGPRRLNLGKPSKLDQFHPDMFREDLPERIGKHGRRKYFTQVKDSIPPNPNNMSQIDTQPMMFREYDDWLRDQKWQHDVPPGKNRHFVQHLPRQDYPKSQNHNMGDRKLELKNSLAGNQLHSNKADLNWGQIRHSMYPGDMNASTRPKRCNQMDKTTSLGDGN